MRQIQAAPRSARSRFERPRRLARGCFLALITTSCSATSCQTTRGGAAEAYAALGANAPSIDEYVRWERELVFGDGAASGTIKVFLDAAPGFVVADRGQAQIRVYSDDARLLWSAGHDGPGPQEYQGLVNAVRTSRGALVALDNAGKLVYYEPTGVVRRTVNTGLSPTNGIWLLNDSTLLISGRSAGDVRSPLLHVWNMKSDRIERSFFTVPPHDPAFDEAYRFSGWASAAVVSPDTIAVIYALADTVYLLRPDGTPISKHPIGLRYFHRVHEPEPRDQTEEAQTAWRNSYTRISEILRGPDGSLYVQYFNLQRLEPVWGVARLRLSDTGLETVFDVPRSPRLLGISPRNSRLFFLKADSLESVTWSVGQMR